MQKGEPHLTDFGLARLVESESRVTQHAGSFGHTQLHGARTSGGKQRGCQQRYRCLWTWRSTLPIADRSSAFCRRNNLRDDQVTVGYRAAATAPLKSENRSRPLNNLPQVSRERSKAPLFVRSRAGRRPGTLAKARADSGAPHRDLRPRQKMGATKSNQRAPCGIAGRIGSGSWLDRLEKRIYPASGNNWNRRSAV